MYSNCRYSLFAARKDPSGMSESSTLCPLCCNQICHTFSSFFPPDAQHTSHIRTHTQGQSLGATLEIDLAASRSRPNTVGQTGENYRNVNANSTGAYATFVWHGFAIALSEWSIPSFFLHMTVSHPPRDLSSSSGIRPFIAPLKTSQKEKGNLLPSKISSKGMGDRRTIFSQSLPNCLPSLGSEEMKLSSATSSVSNIESRSPVSPFSPDRVSLSTPDFMPVRPSPFGRGSVIVAES